MTIYRKGQDTLSQQFAEFHTKQGREEIRAIDKAQRELYAKFIRSQFVFDNYEKLDKDFRALRIKNRSMIDTKDFEFPALATCAFMWPALFADLHDEYERVRATWPWPCSPAETGE